MRTLLPIDRVRAAAAGASLLAALVVAALAPAGAAAHHDRHGSDDPGSWSGAGGGWSGGSWRHSAGSGGSTAAWTPADVTEADVRELRVNRPAISPNGDAEGDEVFVSFRLRRSTAPVGVTVVDAAGSTVRTLGAVRTGGSYGRFGWDGTSDAGAPVADGAYRIVLGPVASTARDGDAPDRDPLAVDVLVDTAAPSISARRPTLLQLRSLARRAGTLRDERRRWSSRRHRHPHGGPPGQRGRGNGNGNGGEGRWSKDEGEWVRLWESRQLRLPVTFTAAEDGTVSVTTQVGGRSTSMQTWRTAGRHTLDVVLPTYVNGQRLTITLVTSDAAGNSHRHRVVATLPAMPARRTVRRTTSGDRTTAAPVTGVPTSTAGPFSDWLDPIMLRATYAAGVPQSWAKSQALANIVYRESSWRPTAQNPTSTAYGLFQFLDQTWATVGCRKTSDAYQQSVCGLRYIQRRYRTPEAAWRFWQANHWY